MISPFRSPENQERPWPARRSVFDERWPLRLTGLLSQRDTGATKSRRRSYFFMNNTLPSGADCVRNGEKKYLQSWRNERATSLQYRRKALGLTWRCTFVASVAGVLAKFGSAWGCSGIAGFGINTRTFGLGGSATVGGCTVGGETGCGSDSCDS